MLWRELRAPRSIGMLIGAIVGMVFDLLLIPLNVPVFTCGGTFLGLILASEYEVGTFDKYLHKSEEDTANVRP